MQPIELQPPGVVEAAIRETTCRQCCLPVVADSHGNYICGAGHRGNVWGHRLDYEMEQDHEN